MSYKNVTCIIFYILFHLIVILTKLNTAKPNLLSIFNLLIDSQIVCLDGDEFAIQSIRIFSTLISAKNSYNFRKQHVIYANSLFYGEKNETLLMLHKICCLKAVLASCRDLYYEDLQKTSVKFRVEMVRVSIWKIMVLSWQCRVSSCDGEFRVQKLFFFVEMVEFRV